MKKFFKVLLTTVISLLILILLFISIAIWFVFTPEKLTPQINKQTDKNLTCQSEIGEVELTFFSTFPNFGLKLKDFILINPAKGSVNDTLLSIQELEAIIDAKTYWKKGDIIVQEITFINGYMNVFSDSLGNTNYDIIIESSDTVTSNTSSKLPFIEIKKAAMKNVNLDYQDLALKLNTSIRGLDGKMSIKIFEDSLNGQLEISKSQISLEYEGEKYLQNTYTQLVSPIYYNGIQQLIRLENAKASVNSLNLEMDGYIAMDEFYKNFDIDLKYELTDWPIKKALELVPPSYQNYFEAYDVDGLLTSQGSIKGLYSEKEMPLLDIQLLMQNGSLKIADLPFALSDMEANIQFYSDLSTDSISYLQINNFRAKTPKSSFQLKGKVNQLYSDIYSKLSIDADLKLDEFNSMLPDSLKMDISGKAKGNVKTAFSMTQLEKIQLEKMIFSGNVKLTDFNLIYDSISLNTNASNIDFALPNPRLKSINNKFVYGNVQIEQMQANKLNTYSALLKNASFLFETSDLRQTASIPYINCSYSVDSLYAKMDTMDIAIEKPNGNFSIVPRANHTDQARVKLAYASGNLKAGLGENKMSYNRIDLNADIENDASQEDVFLQWLIKGYLDMDQANISMTSLSHPILIPSIKMHFDPENFIIQEAHMQIDKSDFELKGNLNNVLSYFRGVSILKGNFNFASKITDLNQLMALTSGLGTEESAKKQDKLAEEESDYSGPYLVPKGIDFNLNTKINFATFGNDTASNIRGNVRVKDGVLVLDELKFKTPAARMQVTALYRTPRKNHLYLGLDYHMLNVEIEELLTMIPDIDTLMPMLRSFGGKGEFHFAGETYLDSLYNMKKSTIRAASSIKGNNLVLMDGETFGEIAKKLNFNRKTVNRVDSLSAEFTIFRDEIDIYPFLIVMDKYKAVIGGRHNFDLSFNYHISVVESPLLIRLGVDVKGTMDDLSYSLAKPRYAQYYRPVARKEVENRQLELRKMIRESLVEKVKEE